MVIGEIKQYRKNDIGALDNHQIALSGYGRIGVSISEDDFMTWGKPSLEGGSDGFSFKIKYAENEEPETIYLGKTFIYETEYPIGKNTTTKLIFDEDSDNIPDSILVNIVCGSEYSKS